VDTNEPILYLDAKAEFKGNVLLKYARQFSLKVFVETGTYSGEMVKYVSSRHPFEKIYSIELSELLYHRAVKLFENDKRITILHGDSGDVLKTIGLRVPALFWLDAHYSCGCTARGKKISPLFEELETVVCEMDHVIVIDDLDNLPKWGAPTDKIIKFIQARKPQTEYKIIDTMLVVSPCLYGGI
jgi:hypothetical protein